MLSQEKATLAGQDRLCDITTFHAWVAAKLGGKDREANFYQRRSRPEYNAAFAAWLALDPLKNPFAPAGPIFMPEYKSVSSQESAKLAQDAKDYFEHAVAMRENGDQYVRITVFLATVLLLTALSQRFEILGPRAAVGRVSVQTDTRPRGRGSCICPARRECVLDRDVSQSVTAHRSRLNRLCL